ncbi:MAG: pentapeptide repeat-containing protein, partial [Anaerolineae bacterium]|nr:pentapeptide repeat-containing protein [Anaerolineae bacterium]
RGPGAPPAWAGPGGAGGAISTTWGSNGAKPGGKRAKLPSGCPPNCAEEDLTGLNLRGLNLSGADLHGANLFVADLQQANLSRANMAGVDLGGANLVGADLRGTNLEGADLRGAKYDEQTMWPANFNPGRAGAIRKSD